MGLALDTYAAIVVPAVEGLFPGMPEAPDENATAAESEPRSVAAISTNAEPALRVDRRSVAGSYVIAEFRYDPDLSPPTTYSHKVSLRQAKDVRTAVGAVYAGSDTA